MIEHRMSCLAKTLWTVGIVALVLLALLIIGIKVVLGDGDSVYDRARRVPSNFYQRVQDLLLGDSNYRQPENSQDCLPYALAYIMHVKPQPLADLYHELGGFTEDFRGAVHGRYGVRLDTFNVLLGADRKWIARPYASWQRETELYMRSHLPVVVFPEVPGGGYHAIIVTRMTQTHATYFDPETGAFYTVPLEDLFRAMLGDKPSDGGYVFNRRKVK
jgi:hypothetical protein